MSNSYNKQKRKQTINSSSGYMHSITLALNVELSINEKLEAVHCYLRLVFNAYTKRFILGQQTLRVYNIII